jgi:hypothetical protein
VGWEGLGVGEIDDKMTYLSLMWGLDQVARACEFTAPESSSRITAYRCGREGINSE